jgi:hypothetical protein
MHGKTVNKKIPVTTGQHRPMEETEGIRKDTVINSVHINGQTITGRNIRFPSVTKSLS